METLRTHQIELNPNNKQSTRMAQHAGYKRVAYNDALSAFKTGLDENNYPSEQDLRKAFNKVKREKYPWSANLSQNASKNAIRDLGDAITRWRKGQNRFPTFKKRSDKCSYQADNGAGTVEVYKQRIHLPKIGWVRMREELRYTGEITKVVVSRKNDRWLVSILIRCDSNTYKHQPPLFDDKPPIGVDVGINTLATCSDGTTFENPRPLKCYERKLARANRALSRKIKFSKNWYKAKKHLGSLHNRISNIREDAHHQATVRIVRKASAIGIETLNISGLLKNRKLAKALSDSALSRFLTMLKYKAERRNVEIIQAGRFFASSKTCSNCGHKKAALDLSERTYHCSECGISIDRDLNAAINLCPS